MDDCERAKQQRRIADMIRERGGPFDDVIGDVVADIVEGNASAAAYAALFAAAHDDRIADALAQVRSIVLAERHAARGSGGA